jgi:hypothetical protein
MVKKRRGAGAGAPAGRPKPLKSDEQFLRGLAATLLADAVNDEECDHRRFTIDVCGGAFKFEGRSPTTRPESPV